MLTQYKELSDCSIQKSTADVSRWHSATAKTAHQSLCKACGFYDDYVRIELHNVPASLKGNDARLTDNGEPCDVHMILARFLRKKIHAFIPRDKNVSKIGGGEAQQNNLTEFEFGGLEAQQNNLTESDKTNQLNELPLMYSLGEDKLTEIFLIGKRTLRFICSDSE